MIKRMFLAMLIISSIVYSQEENEDRSQKIKGKVIDVATRFPLKSAHVLNLTSVKGIVTNRFGEFSISAKKGDEIYFSYIGYESVKLIITNDLLKNENLEIAINEKTVSIKEVTVKAHELVGVLTVDAKNVPNTTPTRVHISGLPQAYEVGLPESRNYNSPLAAVFSPIDFWYQKLGKKSKDMKKLKKLRKDDNLRNIMEQKFNREVMLEFLDLTRDELNDMLKDCRYSSRFIKKASDLQIVDAVINCYENQKTLNKGKVRQDVKRYKGKEE
ncbi:MAG: carboxypeptidase-like regulatory domain-containing protein [Flavobacteriaceae bacterium]|nr:carboxypeptidase-like regulatory domain-containing protein [Flavobacteriaceae bacterium]